MNAAATLHDLIVRRVRCCEHCRLTVAQELIELLNDMDHAARRNMRPLPPPPPPDFGISEELSAGWDLDWLRRLRAAWARRIGSKR